jgi:hypothetical protein
MTDDPEYDAALALLVSQRPHVRTAYEALRRYIHAADRAQDEIHVGHFAEAMAWLMGEIVAGAVPREDSAAALDLWRDIMGRAAERTYAQLERKPGHA